MTVSVIIPNYNAAAFIEQALLSVLSDDAVSEVVVVDDASSDGSVDVVSALGDPRIRLIGNRENIGASQCRDLGVSQASCDLLCFLDADDFLSVGAITNAVKALERDDVDISIFDMVRIDQDGSNLRPFLSAPSTVIDGHAAFCLTLGRWRIHPMGVFRRQTYQQAMQGAAFHGYSDDELITRHLFLNARLVGGNDGVYHYRVVRKASGPERISGQARTALKVLDLAVASFDQPSTQAPVRAARNLTVRLILELAVRGLRSKECANAARSLHSRRRRIRVGWRPSDAPYFGMVALTPIFLVAGRR